MGKKNKGTYLGRTLIKDRFGPRKIRRDDDSMLHTADINDGYDWGRLNLQSVTEESSFQEFLSTAELAGTEFHAEKLNIKFVNPKSGIGLLSKEEREKVLESHEKNRILLKIPRRPTWNESTTAQELQSREKEEFLEWRRGLVQLQESQDLMLTPYEKNLEFWRQLWRVIERSDVVVQIVDARNPLIFRCDDLEKYVKEVNPEKMNVILINKADFLTDKQRQIWADYFSNIGIRVAFFSATLAAEKESIEEESEECLESDNESESSDESENERENESDNESEYTSDFAVESVYESAESSPELNESPCPTPELIKSPESLSELKSSEGEGPEINENFTNSPELLNRDELISLFKTIYRGKTYTEGVTTIGLVGYPNVGKSSTINALLMSKKVSVSATPGKTKHFQTLFVDKDLLLCDCPGLVMPSFVCTKAEMILNGILPIDQMRDQVPPVTLLGTLIPRHVIEDTYGIMIPLPIEGEDPDRPPTAEEILNSYGYNRGFMTNNGQPDNPRSARYLLKDYVNGKLLYCVAPPTLSQEEFHEFPQRKKAFSVNKQLPQATVRATRGLKTTTEDIDKVFFQNRATGVHVRGVQKIASTNSLPDGVSISDLGSIHSLDKPWKKINKHSNKKKREKSRRLYAHLDQH
ncbi:large subunit GTPase 1 homolog isoform X1 [Belonocnema kinseyi]|uniref:large subunit GTPase 1 homolog isoform X1 n=1 Tax=Belonocnema kinseyi TaxID=2817044 RepID=UPI00143CEDF8|nr:large subunit GTPase 1 homolog isoform X1 [Belonocnema kinseyi]